VTFDVDEGSILQVSATDKSSNTKEEITIKNDKGRLDDRKLREKVEARSALEGAVYSLKNELSDQTNLGSLTADERRDVLAAVQEATSFLDENPNAEKEEYAEARERLQSVASPIVRRMREAAAAAGAAGGDDTAEDL
jgi:endoplasmic reticulum chaperone BiP